MSCWPRAGIPVVLSCWPHTAESQVAVLGHSRGAVGLACGYGGADSEVGYGSTVSEVATDAHADVGLVPVYVEGGAGTPPAASALKAATDSVAAAALALAARTLALAASTLSISAAAIGRPKASRAWL